jgi:hypothetical protein
VPRSAGSRAKPSIAPRKAASVLPEPVGARISEWRPAAIGGQPSRWAFVGSANDRRNQSATGGEKTASGSGAMGEM